MAFELDGRFRDEGEGLAIERVDALFDSLVADAVETDTDGKALPEGFEDKARPEKAIRPPSASNYLAVPASAEARTSPPGAAAPKREPGFSRDLVDTYFRQMGGAELLTREQEIALAKRIEAAQRDVLKGLCRSPMLVDRIERWGRELREGRVRFGDVVDLTMADDEPCKDGVADATLGAADLFGRLQAKPEGHDAGVLPTEEDDSDRFDAREARLAPVIAARFDEIAALAREIVALSGKRMTAVTRGREP